MPYQLLDDGFAEHPKIMDLSDRAFRLHVSALCYCSRNLTDGFISDRAIGVLCALSMAKKRQISELIEAGLWDEHDADGCFLIHDYLEYNPSKAEVQERKELRSAAGRLGGKRSGESRREANASASASSNGLKQEPKLFVEPHPIPSHKRSSALRGGVVENLVDSSLRSVTG